MKKLYEELYYNCKDISDFDTSAHFVSIKGALYESSDIRFMLVGRATNEWGSLFTNTAEIFGMDAERQFNDSHRFCWIEDIKGSLYSAYDREKPIKKRYCLDKKHYWTYSKEIFKRLTRMELLSPVWQEHIVWTNLYKIAPNSGNGINNPDEQLKKAQLATCKKILNREIELYRPTHILIFSGYDDWFEPFADIFSEVKDSGIRNIQKGPNKNYEYVEATAKFGDSKVVISCRPDYRDKDRFVEQIINTFNNI